MTGKVRLTFCFKHFYPSNIPYCHILKDIIDACDIKNYSVNVVTSKKYTGKEQHVLSDYFTEKKVKPTLLKVTKNSKISNLLFPFSTFFHLLFHGRGVVIVPSTPPVLMGFSACLAKKMSFSRFEYIYHCQDIHPEALELSGIISKGLPYKFLLFLDKLSVKNSKSSIVLSQDMKSTLQKRFENKLNNISIINNFMPSVYENSLTVETKTIRSTHKPNDIIFVFAGNLGVFQNLENLLEAFLKLTPEDNIYLYFIGDGKMKSKLMNTSNEYSLMKRNIIFLEKMDSSLIASFISTADYGVVSLSEGLLDVAYPSKILTYLNLGLPLFLSGGAQTNLYSEIQKNDLGIATESSSAGAIYEGILLAKKNQKMQLYKQQNIKTYYQEYFDKDDLITKLMGVIDATT